MNRRTSTATVDMFPFLSVLCCVIGALILFMLLIMGTRVVEVRRVANVSPYAEQGSELGEQEYRQLQSQLDELKDRLAEQVRQLEQLLERRDELQALLAMKRAEDRLANGAGLIHGARLVDHPVCRLVPVRARDEAMKKRPIFIETEAKEFLVQPGEHRFSIRDLPLSDDQNGGGSGSNTPFQELLHEAYGKRAIEYLIFLIRPNGVESFQVARRYVQQKYPPTRRQELSAIDFGWEPFAEEWSLLSDQEGKSGGGP